MRAFHNCAGSIPGLGIQPTVLQDGLGLIKLGVTSTKSGYKHYAPRPFLLYVSTQAGVNRDTYKRKFENVYHWAYSAEEILF